ncbi:MAG: sugar phosphate isomerase/epimerase family protein [Planctomycetota bacterium]
MQRPMRNRWMIAAAILAFIALATTTRAGETAKPGKTAWAPKLYGFCMDTHDSKHRSMPEQAQMLAELGFAGAGYRLWLDENLDKSLDKNLKTLDEAGLAVYLLHTAASVKPGEPPFDPRLPDAMRRLKGRPTTVCVLFRGLPPGDPRGMETAVETLRQLGDLAAQNDLRVSVYHHTNDWTESLIHTLAVVRKADHPRVGANFNLCHWLKVDGDKDYRPIIAANADKIFAVTLNGAKVGSQTWTNGLILPLDEGDFDNRALLDTLREGGYRGPVGLMCYGIQGDAREHLARSMKLWKKWAAQW